MAKKPVRIGIVAASSPYTQEIATRVERLATALFPENPPELVVHPNSFRTHGHFAGTDSERAAAFLEIANDPDIDALWFARGGYGACRMADAALEGLKSAARDKIYLGYSDAGVLLAGLYKAGYSVAHGPMCQDIVRDGGEAAIERALRWLVERDSAALEPSLADGQPAAAFNMITLSQILGTSLQPDLRDHVLMLEEISEYMYKIDRTMHHITAHPDIRKVAGFRLGRCGDITPNDTDFGMTEEAVVREWCDRSGIRFLGRADIGHDAANRIVPFGPQ
ncbi:LD-carboxypeptidase [Parasphingopyxis sp. CP4]|uniref:LD-carboxypeptidase n=1 Tax=Parasphingopyxis sp. CP4 TaxID=2724527 RepID=UPI00159FE56B|nr:LD-carboxypeptidase [Parasphingopyxis sp. CP4]QLC21142.1 LD-carboxypeptidase [Parasphingopyxis sp. CP4]